MTARPVVRPGRAYPLGAHWDGAGTNFSVFSERADRVQVCLFDRSGYETVVDLPECIGYVWHGYLPGVGPGTPYGFRVHGPTGPGDLHHPSKLLLDPYARAVDGPVRWDPHHPGAGPLDATSTEDTAPWTPRGVVVDPAFDWRGDRRPAVPWNETVLYEAHVRGLTRSHPGVPEALRGTYLGVCSPAVVEHLVDLGVTTLELMPVHQFVHDRRLVAHGLRNYWGYNSIGYFAPHDEYASAGGGGAQVAEFKEMVRTLHAAGIEVVLDVVYNHTAEGGSGGPVLSFKGLDNRAYYRLDPQDPSRYVDYTGTGNTLNMRHPHVLQLIMDSLRYWVEELHVDGFRFDLAATLARELHDVDRLSSFFDLIQQDPVVNQVKLIAEPWDVGEGGYQVGNFPPLWSEWNGRYRDCVRDVWRGRTHALGELGARLTGSSDLYEDDGRRPHASINFVTAHDGFTLADLVTYEHKRNEPNGEHNRDGTDDNRSWNCGTEGPTDDPAVLALRARQQRNLLATLVLSQGVPMLLAGDELGRTQHGNNNGYAQDNPASWVDWSATDEDLHAFVRRLLALRRSAPALRRRRFLTGEVPPGRPRPDVAWFNAAGRPMSPDDWADGRSLAMWLDGHLVETDELGEPVVGPTALVIVHPSADTTDWVLPPAEWGGRWDVALDTAASPAAGPPPAPVDGGTVLRVEGRSVVVLLHDG